MRAVLVTRSTHKTVKSIKYYYEVKDSNYLVDTIEGKFHQFMQWSDNGSMDVVAIVELADGTIITPLVSSIRFI